MLEYLVPHTNGLCITYSACAYIHLFSMAISVLILTQGPLTLLEMWLNFTTVKIKGQLGCVPVKGGYAPALFLSPWFLSGFLWEADLQKSRRACSPRTSDCAHQPRQRLREGQVGNIIYVSHCVK